MPIEKIDNDLCNSCKVCVEACPMDVIRWNKETRKPIMQYVDDCIACYNCEMDCEVQAIYVTPQRGSAVTPSW